MMTNVTIIKTLMNEEQKKITDLKASSEKLTRGRESISAEQRT